MRSLRLFWRLLGWDLLREVRRGDTVANMSLFALLVLFVGQIGLGDERGDVLRAGPVLFWIAILFAGTIGLSQTFAHEREENRFAGVVTAPVDLGVVYLAKVAASWIYVSVMEVFLLGAYVVLFNFDPGERKLALAAVISSFTLAYMAPGVVLAAMTTTLRAGGEVVLRILLIPLMLPVVWVTLRVSHRVFDAVVGGGLLEPMEVRHYLVFILSLCTIYLIVGYLLFPCVVEE